MDASVRHINIGLKLASLPGAFIIEYVFAELGDIESKGFVRLLLYKEPPRLIFRLPVYVVFALILDDWKLGIDNFSYVIVYGAG